MSVLPHEKRIVDYQKTLKELQDMTEGTGMLSGKELSQLDKKLARYKEQVYASLSPSERVSISRHPGRPHTSDYIKALCDDFQELAGDRTYRDDSAIIGGLGRIGSQKFVIIGQEKGHDTEGRLKHNFGMPYPEGFRKALRLMQLAEKFGLPVLSFVDTPGAYAGLAAEERGQGYQIALNLREMVRIAVPIVVVVIGEGASGGALAIAMGDRIGMLEHAYYSVISPEGCASILWKDTSKKAEAAVQLKLNAENLLEFGIIDEIIKEPSGGAHHDTKAVFDAVRSFVLSSYEALCTVQPGELLEQRYLRFRKIGA